MRSSHADHARCGLRVVIPPPTRTPTPLEHPTTTRTSGPSRPNRSANLGPGGVQRRQLRGDQNNIAPKINRGAVDAAGQLFQLIEQLVELAPQVEDLVHWRQIEHQYVIPRVNYVAGTVARGIDEAQRSRWQSWWGHFSSALQDLLNDIGRQAAEKSLGPALEIASAIDPALPPDRRAENLSRKALWVLASTPGVSCVLVGMRRTPYVSDAMAVTDWPALDDTAAVFDRMEQD